MQTVKPCPKSCTFDWVTFHKLLDIAAAHMIEESGPNYGTKYVLPTKTPMIELMDYSNKKRLFQKNGEYATEGK